MSQVHDEVLAANERYTQSFGNSASISIHGYVYDV